MFNQILAEAALPIKFPIHVNGKSVSIVREYHLRDKREGDLKPKDYKMSKNKYEIFFNLLTEYEGTDKAVTATWTNNGKSNAISFSWANTIGVFGAIMRSTKDYNTLYRSAQIRIHLGELSI